MGQNVVNTDHKLLRIKLTVGRKLFKHRYSDSVAANALMLLSFT